MILVYIWEKSTNFHTKKKINFSEKIGSKLCLFICSFASIDPLEHYSFFLFSFFISSRLQTIIFELYRKILKAQNST